MRSRRLRITKLQYAWLQYRLQRSMHVRPRAICELSSSTLTLINLGRSRTGARQTCRQTHRTHKTWPRNIARSTRFTCLRQCCYPLGAQSHHLAVLAVKEVQTSNDGRTEFVSQLPRSSVHCWLYAVPRFGNHEPIADCADGDAVLSRGVRLNTTGLRLETYFSAIAQGVAS